MKKRTLLLILTLFIIQIPSIYADEEYHHILTLESPNPNNNAWFGYQVKIRGDIIAVSETKADVVDVQDAGKVYIYDTNGDLISTLQSPTPGMNNYFGHRLDLFGNTVVIREPWADIGELTNTGKAHVFTTDGTHQLTLQSPEPNSKKDRDDHLLFFLLQDSFFLSCFDKTYQLSLSYPTFLVRF